MTILWRLFVIKEGEPRREVVCTTSSAALLSAFTLLDLPKDTYVILRGVLLSHPLWLYSERDFFVQRLRYTPMMWPLSFRIEVIENTLRDCGP